LTPAKQKKEKEPKAIAIRKLKKKNSLSNPLTDHKEIIAKAKYKLLNDIQFVLAEHTNICTFKAL
jgi:hypothetical protein